MATYRLVWSGDGALDLSQVLDTRGRPIVLSPRQREASVSADILQNPYVQRYLKTPQLRAEPIDGPKPVMPPSTSTPAPPVPLKAAVTKEKTVTPDEVMTKDTVADTASSAEPPLSSTTPSPTPDAETEPKGGFFKGRKGRK